MVEDEGGDTAIPLTAVTIKSYKSRTAAHSANSRGEWRGGRVKKMVNASSASSL